MKGFYSKWRLITSLLIILLFLLTVTLKILEKPRPPEQIDITSLPLGNTAKKLKLSRNASMVKGGLNYTNQVADYGVQVDKQEANRFILYQAIWKCMCSRRFMYPLLSPQNFNHKINKLNSSCSDEGTHYQPNQKVISVSMWVPSQIVYKMHSAPSYRISILQNLIKMRQHYPNYSFRIYTNTSLVPKSPWCKLLCENDDLFWCDIRSTPSHGNLVKMDPRGWRFLALGDPTVQIFHSRDLDSLISYREAAAVQDWLENVGYKAFQLMRHCIHHTVPMLGGMWGAQNTRLLNKSRGIKLREKFISQLGRKNGYGVDQKTIKYLIVEKSGKDVVAYDSYHCKQWNKTLIRVRPFPVQRKDTRDFVGNRNDFLGKGKGTLAASKCPVECRPSYGKDWIYC